MFASPTECRTSGSSTLRTKTQLSIQSPNYAFTDFCFRPADDTSTPPITARLRHPSYVDRFDMVTDTWSVPQAPSIAYEIKVVDDQHVILQTEDQWINITLNTYGPV